MNLALIPSKTCWLFDLDGTLIDTKQANLISYQTALRDFGFEVSIDSLEKTWGMDSTIFIPKLFPDVLMGDDLVADIQNLKSEYYPTYFKETVPNFPLISLICHSKTFKVKIGIVTTSKSKNAIPLLEFHGLIDLFDFYVFGEDIKIGKPSPEPYLKAIALSGEPARSHLVFEDSDTGVASASAAGLDVVRIGAFG